MCNLRKATILSLRRKADIHFICSDIYSEDQTLVDCSGMTGPALLRSITQDIAGNMIAFESSYKSRYKYKNNLD